MFEHLKLYKYIVKINKLHFNTKQSIRKHERNTLDYLIANRTTGYMYGYFLQFSLTKWFKTSHPFESTLSLWPLRLVIKTK